METKIKEELKDQSLSFESSGDNLASLTLLEKYDRYCRNDNLEEVSEDEDFFPDEIELQEEYARLRTDTANYADPKRRLTTGLSRRNVIADPELSVVDDDTTDNDNGDIYDGKSDIVNLDEFIQELSSIRKCEPDGNSIFCTETELEKIRENYQKIIDFILDRISKFEKTSSEKDLTEQQSDEKRDDTSNNDTSEQNNSGELQLLSEKMEKVRQARDRFYEVEQVVKEQLIQLEVVERYKLGSLG